MADTLSRPSPTKLIFEDNDAARALFGQHSQNVKIIERHLKITSHIRGNQIILEGSEGGVAVASRVLRELYQLVQTGYLVGPQDIQYALRILKQKQDASLKDIFLDTVYISAMKRRIAPKGLNQKHYIESIRAHDMVFGIGPAGTGKTYLAMAMAVAALMNNDVHRIVLARPAVEAGEKLGFLPGDLYEKVNPYLRPLYDALHDMMDFEKAAHLIQQGVIEVAPLAFMRGRTLNNSFVILDEAQNTTSEQMMMFLTRLGFGSKAVITGDITQIDLPSGTISGLVETRDLLKGIAGIDFVYFNKHDVVRHPLVLEIIQAYESHQRGRAGRSRTKPQDNSSSPHAG